MSPLCAVVCGRTAPTFWNLHIGDRSQRIATESHGAVLSRFAFTSDGSLMAAVGHSPDI
ncbi:hypothetical protein ACH40D_02605 [Streptomyces olivaceoviridis]|uniref:Uncharacterized protein n=1 Tax=Streptomyces olivaceoviridis TaxID=1921 RepID=A0ABW7V1J3_STROI|nr:hypothetical protein [Streptomyces corchorusii]